MVAGYEAMSTLTPAEYDRLAGLDSARLGAIALGFISQAFGWQMMWTVSATAILLGLAGVWYSRSPALSHRRARVSTGRPEPPAV
jgi:hypothetical protein